MFHWQGGIVRPIKKINDDIQRGRLLYRIITKVYVDDNGCWIFNGTPSKSRGYGKIYYGNKTIDVHKAILISKGIKIPVGKVVCHKCNNKKCCNPDHLYVNSQSHNIKSYYKQKRSFTNVSSN